MEYTKLGKTDMEISKVCVGCMSFGKAGTMHDWTLNPEQSEAVIHQGLFQPRQTFPGSHSPGDRRPAAPGGHKE